MSHRISTLLPMMISPSIKIFHFLRSTLIVPQNKKCKSARNLKNQNLLFCARHFDQVYTKNRCTEMAKLDMFVNVVLPLSLRAAVRTLKSRFHSALEFYVHLHRFGRLVSLVALRAMHADRVGKSAWSRGMVIIRFEDSPFDEIRTFTWKQKDFH